MSKNAYDFKSRIDWFYFERNLVSIKISLLVDFAMIALNATQRPKSPDPSIMIGRYQNFNQSRALTRKSASAQFAVVVVNQLQTANRALH